MIGILVTVVNILYWVIFVLILARVILSWVNFGSYELRDLIFRLTEPILAPIRRLLPASTGLDLSPMLVLIGVSVLRQILIGFIYRIG